MGKKQAPKILVFPPSIHWICKWVDPEVLGIPSRVSFEFLRSFREENLITPKGEYKEDYIMEVPDIKERVCYLNHKKVLNWIWMDDILILNFRARMPCIDFQFTILEQTVATPS